MKADKFMISGQHQRMKKSLIVVLGMHRSGTSAITRGLKALNVDLGDNLLEPLANNNEKGFWEDKDIYNFNEMLLEKLGKKWHNLKIPELKALLSDALFQEKLEALELLRKKIEAYAIWGIKDPRFSILLPFWKRVFEELSLDVGYIISVRNPFEVALSLEKRDQFTKEKALSLWGSHMLCSVEYTGNEKRVFVSYDLLLENPQKELLRISEALNLARPDENTNSLKEYENKFLTRTLKHQNITDFTTHNLSHTEAWIANLYAHIHALACEKYTIDTDIFTQFNSEFFSFNAFFERIDFLELAMENQLKDKANIEYHTNQILIASEEKLNRNALQLVKLNEEVCRKDSQISALQEELRKKAYQINDLQRTINELFTSTSWKISAPARLAKELAAKKLDDFSSKHNNSLIKIGKKIYRHLPLHTRPIATKLVFGVAGRIFKNTPQYKRWENTSLTKFVYDNQVKRQQLVLLSEIPISHNLPAGKVAVHLHLFYIDLADKFVGHLKKMPFSYDLFISVSDSSNKSKAENLFSSLPNLNRLQVIVVENRGRDIAPFLSIIGPTLGDYAYIAHIHSKKSLYNGGITNGWLDYILDSLFASDQNIKRIFYLFETHKKIGFVYPQNYSDLPYMANTWLANKHRAESLRSRLSLNGLPSGYFDYPTGSMFWARSESLRPIFDADFNLDEFEPESGQTDGTLAHCLERMLALVANQQGFDHAILADEASPSWSPWRFEQHFNRSAASVAAQIHAKEIKLVIFDIFDTLLIRPLLDPEKVKELVAKRGSTSSGETYLKYRATAELAARSKSNQDVSLNAIYIELSRMSDLTTTDLTLFREAEELLEEALVNPRADAVYLLNEAEKSGKKIVLASDMFLPKSLIERILEKNSLSGWTAFYLSNEVGLRKDTGDLYHHILKSEGVTPENTLMVGDSERSDFQIPCDLGMQFIHVLRPTEIARGTLRFSKIMDFTSPETGLDRELLLGSLTREHFGKIFYPAYDPFSLVPPDGKAIGHSVLGPICLSFAQWLAQRASSNRIKKLYFLSREGEFLKNVYDFWRSKTGEGPESEYLVVSRRAVAVPSIASMDDVFTIAKKTFYSNSLNLFLLERFGLELTETDLEDLYNKKLWKKDRSVEIIDEDFSLIKPLLEHLFPRIIDIARSEKVSLLQHLEAKELSSSNSHQAVVDVGYAASIQGELCKLLGKKIHGYYVITNERASLVRDKYNVNIEGCFGNFIPEKDETHYLHSRSFELEKLLSSNAPQVINYKSTDSGEVEAQYRPLSDQEISSSMVRSQIREGAMLFCERAIEIRTNLLNTYRIPTDITAYIYQVFVLGLSDAEKRIMESLVLDDYYCGRGLVS